MSLGYSATGSSSDYRGGISSGSNARGNWKMLWEGADAIGPTPLQAIIAARDNLAHRQRSPNAASPENAKLLFAVEKLISEASGKPDLGSELNDLIPTEE